LAKVAQLDLTTWEIGGKDYPQGSVEQIYKKLGEMSGGSGLKFTINTLKREMNMLFRETPAAIRAAKIDVLIIDQISSSMSTVADHLNIPFITVCNAMLVHREPGVPPYSTHWKYSTSFSAVLRNRFGNSLIDLLTRDLWKEVSLQRKTWGLPPYKRRDDAYSPLAQLCQLPKEFDFPRKRLPDHFHYIGRFQDPSGSELLGTKDLSFPFHLLTGQPLIYASLGTLQNRRPEIFHCIAKACSEMDVQLVISLGNPKLKPVELPGNPIVVPFAPHQQLIERSTVVVTHAGMNTVLTALGCGVPLVAIPITNEQPGIASRLQQSGAGKTIRLEKLNEETLLASITEVMENPHYREEARRMKNVIQAAGGVSRAADIIEKAAKTREPVIL